METDIFGVILVLDKSLFISMMNVIEVQDFYGMFGPGNRLSTTQHY